LYLHLGGEKIIRTEELIAVFDISAGKSSKISKQFINNAQKNDNIEIIGEEESKSLIVSFNKIYYSPISSNTLKRRVNQMASNELKTQ